MNKKQRKKLFDEANKLVKDTEQLIEQMEKDLVYMGQQQWGWLRESRKFNNNQK